ncbi:MAG: putative glycoside hydrolase [Nitrososphaerales archaeon]
MESKSDSQGSIMRLGVVLDKPEPVEDFDLTFYHIKPVSGRINKAAERMYNIVSCFGDNKTAREKPEWVALSKQDKATRGNKRHNFLWDWICPTNEDYVKYILDLIDEASKVNIAGIHLDCVHFPEEEYCTCQRCTKMWKESKLKWARWKSNIINEFVEEISKLVKVNFSITLPPDPCSSKERFGIDFTALAKYADFLVIPLYDKTYSTTYWIEILARYFRRRIKVPLYIELYAGHPRPFVKNIIKAMVSASNYSDGIIFATYDISIAKEIKRSIK